MFNKELLLKYKTPFIFGFTGLIFLIVALVFAWKMNFSNRSGSFDFIDETSQATASSGLKNSIFADIEGAVVNPGVYKLEESSRVNALLEKAGGLSSHADLEYVAKNLNKAQVLTDGVKIYIPSKGENLTEKSSITGNLINLNTASLADLDSLSGIGEKTAQKIFEARPFLQINELTTKKIVSESVFEKIKDKITVF